MYMINDLYFTSLFQLKNFISKQSAEGDATNLLVLVFQVLMYLIFGHVVFIFIPAVAIKFIEDWSYLDSVYFAFITLTTIGFGDLVAGTICFFHFLFFQNFSMIYNNQLFFPLPYSGSLVSNF